MYAFHILILYLHENVYDQYLRFFKAALFGHHFD